MTARILALALAALALAAGRASADEPTPKPATAKPAGEATASGPAAERVRVRATHRVDVIAPGEKVETVIDRLRAGRSPAAEPGARPADARPVRPPEHDTPGDHAAPGGPRSPHGGTGPNSRPGHGPASGPGHPGERTGASPDRPHR
jgi:hypothetical protein